MCQKSKWRKGQNFETKLDLGGGGVTAPGYYIKNKTSPRSRKPPNPYPTHTQRHCSPPGPDLRPVLWCGTDEGIFLTTA
jgi:hypothetical protein